MQNGNRTRVRMRVSNIKNTFTVNTEYLCTMKEEEVVFGVYGRDWETGERAAVIMVLLEDEVSCVLLGVDGETVLPFLRLVGVDEDIFCSFSSSFGEGSLVWVGADGWGLVFALALSSDSSSQSEISS